MNITTAPVTVTFTITPTANDCPGAPITATVLVNPKPDAGPDQPVRLFNKQRSYASYWHRHLEFKSSEFRDSNIQDPKYPNTVVKQF